MAGLRTMNGAPRLLVDVRETGNLRGFHALAALYLIADRLRPVELARIGGETADESIACQAFCFDTGLELHTARLPEGDDTRFDLYLSAADAFPWDETSVGARRVARRTIAALMFGLREPQPSFAGAVVVGHETAEIAARVAAELRLPSPEHDA
jgi:hypothetical protein